MRAGNDRLGNVAGIPNATVRDDRHIAAADRLVDLGDGRNLRHADTGNDPRRADRAGTDTDLDAVGASVDEHFRGFAGDDIAGNELQ